MVRCTNLALQLFLLRIIYPFREQLCVTVKIKMSIEFSERRSARSKNLYFILDE